jgi:hypothetical protein
LFPASLAHVIAERRPLLGERGADVFATSDAPVLRALRLYREEHVEDMQPIQETFAPR